MYVCIYVCTYVICEYNHFMYRSVCGPVSPSQVSFVLSEVLRVEVMLCDVVCCYWQAVADIIRTTLGPRSMLKMLLDAQGGTPTF